MSPVIGIIATFKTQYVFFFILKNRTQKIKIPDKNTTNLSIPIIKPRA